MSIPKVIHYCWFGKGKMPPLFKKCIKSWEKYCPGYEIKCWNEDNFNLDCNRYVSEAYEAQKWAFVTDYVRLKVLYEEGGIYFDTDVELIKPIDFLTDGKGFMGFDENGLMCTGLGCGCEAGNELVGELLKDYDNIPFKLEDGKYDLTPCPDRNAATLKRLGMDVSKQSQTFMGIRFLPREYLCPMEYISGKLTITDKTCSIHHYSASWTSKTSKRTRIAKRILGVKLYDKLYGKFLHKVKWLEW